MTEPNEVQLTRREKELALQKIKAREIVSEIVKFGVTQYQILYIVKLLSLELEDITLMHALTDIISQSCQTDTEGTTSGNTASAKTKIFT